MGSSSSLRVVLAAIGWMACGAGMAFGIPAIAQPATVRAPTDPVGEAMAEASWRFKVPLSWIRAVIQIESAGERGAVSHAGAMGLMQLMPATYAELRRQYDLGPDPFAVRDNIMAGTAYLRRMYDRYGSPGFLAAYNAGPGRWEDHLAGRRSLPAETVNYLERLGPVIGFQTPVATSVMPRAAAPPPLEVDIFVGAGVVDVAAGPTAEQRRVLTILAANPSNVPRSDRLFVTRSETSRAMPSPTPIAARSVITEPFSEVMPVPPDVDSITGQGPLFVTRRLARGDHR
jgi:hypothetical protein